MSIGTVQNFQILSVPFQPFISKNTNIINYQEELICWNPAILKKGGLVYQFTIQNGPAEISFVPDACINFLFRCDSDKQEAWVFGLSTETTSFVLEDGATYFGLKPYSTVGMSYKTGAVSDLVNRISPFTDVFGATDILLDHLLHSQTFDERKMVILNYAYEHMLNQEYQALPTEYLSILLCTQTENFSMQQVKEELGYSERYSQRLFKHETGITPKQYSRIIRFQNCLKELLFTPSWGNLADTAIKLGYYDQAHLIHDFRSFTQKSPLQFKKEIQER